MCLMCVGLVAQTPTTTPAPSPTPAPTATPVPTPFDPLAAYVNLYRTGGNNYLSIAQVTADGAKRLLATDFRSGQTRLLTPAANLPPDNFTAGPGLATVAPTAGTINFERDAEGRVKRVTWQQEGTGLVTGEPVGVRREEVAWASGAALLSGTLLTPAGRGRWPVVLLLPDAGQASRAAFGPWPDFFLSKGYAVMVYDQRGTGASGGSPNPLTTELATDGRSALQFLRGRSGLDTRRVGLAGFGLGGSLAASAAANNRDVAWMINFSGSFVPLAEQEAYRLENRLRAANTNQSDINRALGLLNAGFNVGRTGQGWDAYARLRDQSTAAHWAAGVPHWSTLDEAQTYWNLFYSYDPARPLQLTACPVLALFGSLDKVSPPQPSAERMQLALRARRNDNFTFYIFPNANHQLLAANAGTPEEVSRLTRYTPGLFEAISLWLRNRK